MFPFTGADLHRHFETGMYPASLVITDDAALWVQRTTSGKQLAVIATSDVNTPLFRELFAHAFNCYPADRASYHVSGELSRVPQIATLPDASLPEVLDQFDARQVLHVTFGSILARFGNDLKATLRTHEEGYYTTLEHHFMRHLLPFSQT